MPFSTAQERRDYIDIIYGNPLSVLSDCLRGFLIASPEHDLLCADFSNIEGRVLAWLAGEAWKVKAFKDFDSGNGEDIYKLAAQKIFYCELDKIDSQKRQIGKVAELALGFGGGRFAFYSMGKNYGLNIPLKEGNKIKMKWRAGHPKIVSYWNEIETLARRAIQKPGQVFFTEARCPKIKYKKSGSFLICQLPSGRNLTYPYPEIGIVTTKYQNQKESITYMSENLHRIWERQPTYGGSLVENITQAVARDLLCEALKRLEARGYPIVMHVHDSIVCEVPEGQKSLEEFKQIMCELPSWATGLPVACEGWRGKRNQK